MKKYVIYTDGSCQIDKKNGGWGCVVYPLHDIQREKLEFNGHFYGETTSNMMELLAIINGLKHIPNNSDVTIYTDSRHIVFGVERGIHIWPQNNWISKNGIPISNKELWLEYYSLMKKHQNVSIQWVKGHSDNHHNQRADILAKLGAEKRIVCPTKQNHVFDVFINTKRNESISGYEWELIITGTHVNLKHFGHKEDIDFFAFYQYLSNKVISLLKEENFQFAHIYSSTRSFGKYFKKFQENVHCMHISDQKIQPQIKRDFQSKFY